MWSHAPTLGYGKLGKHNPSLSPITKQPSPSNHHTRQMMFITVEIRTLYLQCYQPSGKIPETSGILGWNFSVPDLSSDPDWVHLTKTTITKTSPGGIIIYYHIYKGISLFYCVLWYIICFYVNHNSRVSAGLVTTNSRLSMPQGDPEDII